MKATIVWTETVTYTNLIDIDDYDFDEWLGDETLITTELVKEYLNAGDEREWLPHCPGRGGIAYCTDRTIDEVVDFQ